MKQHIWWLLALFGVVSFVAVIIPSFGKDPHEVPFKLAGKKAPEFTMKRLDNNQMVSLNQFKGKPVVINFWATWCEPCKVEHPLINWLAKQHSQDAVFMGIVFEDSEENTKSYLQKNGWEFTQLYDPKSTVAVDYGVAGVPETYFINRQGIIVSKYVGPFVDPTVFEAKLKEAAQ